MLGLGMGAGEQCGGSMGISCLISQTRLFNKFAEAAMLYYGLQFLQGTPPASSTSCGESNPSKSPSPNRGQSGS